MALWGTARHSSLDQNKRNNLFHLGGHRGVFQSTGNRVRDQDPHLKDEGKDAQGGSRDTGGERQMQV